jgi:hypothetical protein
VTSMKDMGMLFVSHRIPYRSSDLKPGEVHVVYEFLEHPS